MNKLISALISVRFTLVCLLLAMVVVFFGTLAQAQIGTFAAQKIYFNQFFVSSPIFGGRLPILPGGLLVGLLWLVNLTAVMLFRMKYTRRTVGLVMVHLGILFLLLGQFGTQQGAHESRLVFEEGETKNYVESSFDSELAVVMTSESDKDQVTSVPLSLVKREGPIELPGLPFSLNVRKFFPNAQIMRKMDSSALIATQGIGPQLAIEQVPVTHRDDETNNISAFVEIVENGASRGVWLLSTALGAPQSFESQNKTYEIYLRPKRIYLPYTLLLKDFRHDIYPGTEIPKNFSSLVELENPAKAEKRDVLICMNSPLRYEGLAFYQASFGKGDTLSVLQVVKNPVWLVPYISCALVVVGLAIHFLMLYFSPARRRVAP